MVPELSGRWLAERRTYDIVCRRVLQAPKRVRKKFTSAIKVKSKIWPEHDGVWLLIDDESGISRAIKRFRQIGELFPGFVAAADNKSMFGVVGGNRKFALSKLTLELGDAAAFRVEPDCGFIVSDIGIKHGGHDYYVDGTLMYLRYGSVYYDENFDDAFDGMIAFFAGSGDPA